MNQKLHELSDDKKIYHKIVFKTIHVFPVLSQNLLTILSTRDFHERELLIKFFLKLRSFPFDDASKSYDSFILYIFLLYGKQLN